MKPTTLAAAVCISLVSATSIDAATFSVLGTDYDLTTITGTFEDNIDQLTSQVWWGKADIAATFVSVTRKTLAGLPNSHPTLGPNVYGAFFANGYGINCPECVVSTAVLFTNQINGTQFMPDVVATFAVVESQVVSPVPLPAGGLLLLTAFAGVAALKRRKKCAA